VKKYLIAGLLVWLPLAITIWVLTWLLGAFDGLFAALLRASERMLPVAAHDAIAAWRDVPGMGVVVLGCILLLTGVFVTNVFGQWWLRQWDRAIGRIPIVKSIYNAVKQVSDTLFSTNGNAFREAVLVQYPRQGSWTIAFVTGRPGGEVAARLAETPEGPGGFISVYVPTTPNPTSGFFLMMPRAEVHELAMTVDEALKYVISMGVVAPPVRAPAAAPGPALPGRN
jgi:uncharacterized membrane protein